MKKYSQQLVAVLMVFVVLMTTMSFTVNMHYCGGMLVDYSLVKESTSCGMEALQRSNSCETQLLKKSCCQNKQLTANGHDDLKPTFHNLNFEQHVFITSFFFSYNALFEPETVENTSFEDYAPPLIIRDIQTLDQVFLI
ncbi:hypothetical protein DSM03_10248 [Leeuwenhoekiella aestuarii]|uniref:Uncharacterized protein n=1 Tax=Leeuwenhoekiella aestuarii TaxID=2249426 RepID=A0A4Q0NWV1_9FLAO|nr:hypothetical protein [Leeuwenhoekiella aestuarii]RXG15719.1 hypothetical protein DSM04_103608 [Leeuwenhoekiella aestuarii]RXG17172.1 hypothetical protein DSM03_10248 [Leeuwenhoekiella aestuarii]